MPTRNVNLTDELSQFVDREVKAGRFQNASEVVRAGLRLYEQHQAKETARLQYLHARLDAAIAEASRGEGVVIDDIDEFMDEIVAGLDEEAATSTRG